MKNKYLYFLLSTNIIFIIYSLVYVYQNEYLPSPFLYDKNDTFMDFFNPLYWSDNDTRYSVWNSIYPPLSFIILKFLNAISGPIFASDPFLLREAGTNIKYLLFLIFLVSPALTIYYYNHKYFSFKIKFIIYFIFISSLPFIFTLERGNLIIFSLPLLSILLFNKNCFLKILSLSLLINLKPYFVILIIPYVLQKNWIILLKTIFATLVIYIITTILLGSGFFSFMQNLTGFNNSIFSLREIMSMPSSITNFSILIENYKDIPMQEIFYFINILIVFLYYILLVFVGWILFVFRENLSEQELLLIILLSMMCFLYQIGGYAIIFFLALLPILYKNFRYGLFFVFLIFLPLDLLPIYSDIIYDRPSYFSNNNVDIYYTLGFGTIFRPIVIYFLLLYVSICIFIKYSNNIKNTNILKIKTKLCYLLK